MDSEIDPSRVDERRGHPVRTLNVLQVVTDRDRRGAQVFATDLAAGLRELGHRVETVALTDGRHGDLLPIESLGPGRRSWRTVRALRARAREVDVVVAHGSATLIACAIGLARSGTPFVYRQISDPLFWAATWSRRLRVAATIRRAAAIVTLAATTRDVLMRHYWLDERRLWIVPNAVPAEGFTPGTADDRRRARERFGLPETVPVVAYVGALADEKGVDLVVRAVAGHPGVHALVVGDGPERSTLEALAHELAPERLQFTGPLDAAIEAYRAADLIVLPSRGGDSMPAVLIEAGLCGLPAVATPIGAITDVVVDGQTGSIVPSGELAAFSDAVGALLADTDRRRSMGDAARSRCLEMFTIQAIAPQWADVLASVSAPGTDDTLRGTR